MREVERRMSYFISHKTQTEYFASKIYECHGRVAKGEAEEEEEDLKLFHGKISSKLLP